MNASASPNIGIFGGTFDPPHIGHLIAAQDACTALSLDRFIFIPAAQPPHKLARDVTDAAVRSDMLRAAVAGNPVFEVNELELRRAGPSYTVETLRQLKAELGGARLCLLIGVDQVREFGSWRQPDEISRLADVVMLSREGAESPADHAGFVRQTVVVTRIDVSSTLIRERVARGQSIRYLVPDTVAEIISAKGLYR